MLSVFTKKRWKSFERAVKVYQEYDTVDFGIAWVNPRDIIGLSLNANEIKNDDKMKRLRSSVYLKGWTNQSPVDLHLFKLPNGKYTVCSGGNHRAYLSNELKIPQIKAKVSIIIPVKQIPEETKSNIEYLLLKEREFDLKAKEINNFLNTKGIYRVDYVAEEALFNKYCEHAQSYLNQRDKLLLDLADRLGYTPKHGVED